MNLLPTIRRASIGAALLLLCAGLDCRQIGGIEEKSLGVEGDAAAPDGGSGGNGGGGGGGADCGGITSFDSDKQNCGACGHDCLGGPCNGGRCGPVTLATGKLPTGIALDGDTIYWTDRLGEHVGKVNKDGTQSKLLLATALNLDPTGIAVNATHVYFAVWNFEADTPSGYIGRIDKSTGTWEKWETSYNGPWELVLDDEAVYWTNANGDMRVLVRKPFSGDPMTVATGIHGGQVLIQTGSNLYYSNWYKQNGTHIGELHRIGKDGTNDVTLFKGPMVIPLAADATYFYWTAKGHIYRSSKDKDDLATETPFVDVRDLPTSTDVASSLVLDGNYAYFSYGGSSPTKKDSVIRRVTLDGPDVGKTVNLVEDLNSVSQIAVDDVAIYWASQYDFSIMKIAK